MRWKNPTLPPAHLLRDATPENMRRPLRTCRIVCRQPGKQDSAHAKREANERDAGRRAHETSSNECPDDTDTDRAWEIPGPDVNPRRPLLFTRTACYFILCSLAGRMPVLSPGLPRPAAYQPLVIRLAANRFLPGSNAPDIQAHAHVETESAIENSAQHRVGVRVRYRRKNQRSQDMTNPGREFVRTSKTADVHCFSRALLVALFCTAIVLSRCPGSVVRMLPRLW